MMRKQHRSIVSARTVSIPGYWPEILLAALFLLGDILFTGIASAVAGAAAGVIAYAASVLAHRRRAVLLLEGLILSALTLIAEITRFPGGALVFFELSVGLFLLVMGLGKKPALSRIAGSIVRGMLSKREEAVLSIVSGGAFLLHGAVSAVLALRGMGGTLFGIALLVPLFLAAGLVSGRILKKHTLEYLPELIPGESGGSSVLSVHGSRTGTVRLIGEGTAVSVEVLDLDPDDLPLLEKALARMGYRCLIITLWSHDTLHLEMNGYARSGSHWRKMLHR